MKRIIFSDHSIEKIKILNKHGFQNNQKGGSGYNEKS